MSRSMPLPAFLGAAAFASDIVAALVSYEWDHTAESRLVRVDSRYAQSASRERRGIDGKWYRSRLSKYSDYIEAMRQHGPAWMLDCRSFVAATGAARGGS